LLSKQAIYHKTPRGLESIANRHSGLAPRARSLLIMVDGKRSYADLCAFNGDCEPLLLQLLQDGLVEPGGGAAATAVGPAQTATDIQQTATASVPLMAASLSNAKRFTSLLVADLLGPTSEQLCIKIEAASDLADFVSAVKRARGIIREVKGVAAAERFIAQVELHTPQT